MPLDGKLRRYGAKRGTAGAKLASTRDGRLLWLIDDEAHAVGVDREAERHGPHAFTVGAFGRECRAGARANQAVLVLGCTVDDRADERVGGGIAVAFAARAHDARPRDRHGALDARREHDVARDPIALGDHEYARLVLEQSRERQTQSRTLGDRRDAAHALVEAPRRHADALATGPCLDGGSLRVSREALFVLGCAQVGDRDAGIAEGRRLAHAPICTHSFMARRAREADEREVDRFKDPENRAGGLARTASQGPCERREQAADDSSCYPEVMTSLPVVLLPGEDGWLVAECPVLPGCISQGRTREEALANIREAIELCLESGDVPRGELRGRDRGRVVVAPPLVSGRECVAALARLGYVRTRQRGSHVRLECKGRAPLTVPMHDELD